MAVIITQTAENALHIKDAFRKMNRDYFPYGVYEAIFDLINETTESKYYNIDVIAWACDISETTLEGSQFAELAELADHLRDETTVLYVDEDKETIWHLVY